MAKLLSCAGDQRGKDPAGTVNNSTISGNAAGIHGGGIANFGTLTVNNSIVSNNRGGYQYLGGGGGIYNVGTAIVNNSTISGNAAPVRGGGGIANSYSGTVRLTNTTISGNTDGGIYNSRSGTVTLANSTVSGNTGFSFGGISNNDSGSVTLTNSTISGNAGLLAGGIYNANSGTVTLTNTTVSRNLGRGIFNNSGATLQTRNTIIAGNSAATNPDVSGNLGSLGHNLIGITSGGSGFHATDLLNMNPLLGPLQDNGGPTFTHALLPGSPAINAGDNTDAPDFDQRGEGFPRVVHGTIDIGAFEAQPANRPPVVDPVADRSIPAGQLLLIVPLSASDPDGDALTFWAEAVSLAFALDQRLGLAAYLPELDNWGGRGEKWLSAGDGRWYFLLANGELYEWDGADQATGEQVGVPGASSYADPGLLVEAPPEDPFAILAVEGDRLTLERDEGRASSLVVSVWAFDGSLWSDPVRLTVTVTS